VHQQKAKDPAAVGAEEDFHQLWGARRAL
jgi:hypothetical protein